MSSGLKIVTRHEAGGRYTVTERLVRDRETGRLGPEETTSGNLAYAVGQEITVAEARRVGLLREDPAPTPTAEVATPQPLASEVAVADADAEVNATPLAAESPAPRKGRGR